MTFQTNVNGVKLTANSLDTIMQDVENIIKGKNCKQCHGRGSYLVANGADDQDWEYCQH